MDDTLFVGVLESPARLDHDVACFFGVERAVLFDVVGQVDAVDELHHDVIRGVLGALMFAEIVDADDVFVLELGGVAGFATEAFDHGLPGLGGYVLRQQHFDGILAARGGFTGTVDGPDAASGQVRDDLVFTQADGFRLSGWGRFGGHGWSGVAVVWIVGTGAPLY